MTSVVFMPPYAVTKMQAVRHFRTLGKLDAFKAHLAGLDEETQEDWANCFEIRHASTRAQAMTAALDLDHDEFFRGAINE